MKFSLVRSLLNLFRQDDGNVAIMLCAAALPLVLIMGGAIDLVRFNRYKEQLANAVDAAALALAREDLVMTDQQATVFIQNYVAAHHVGDREFDVRSLSARNTGTGFEVTAEASMDTIFLPLSAIPDMDLGLSATVERDSGRIELALVLDNTG
jgi:Flp pilus assembly protein TadG